MSYGPADFAAEYDVSRETLGRLQKFDALFRDWSSRHNLVARSTIDDRWQRHYRDSAQLYALIPKGAQTLVDLGSGAGFPGLVLAAMGEGAGLKVTLVESTGKKAAFLRAGIDTMALTNAAVIPQRIENITVSPPDVVTARALAQLGKLFSYAHEFATEKTVLILPKGQDVEGELTEAAKSWHMTVEKRPSVTNPGSIILVIRNLQPKGAKTPKRARKSP
jgi:16S rRNA (guanine527-N7)-methyltransferase